MINFLSILLQQAQNASELADAADTHKFYVVIAVIGVLFAGIVTYLVSLDKKISKLEKK
ncbi:MAG: CcmD family protein [Bacteroidia bacterium]|jgi:hypothetical protein